MTIFPVTGSLSAAVKAAAAPSSTSSFSDVIGAAINQVETTSAAARNATADLLSGARGDIHTVAIESQRAELTMELFQQVRNKFVQTYQEIMRMPM